MPLSNEGVGCNYRDRVSPEEEKLQNENRHVERKPHRIELVGMVCDPYLAAVRGIRRVMMTKRAVKVNS